MALDAAILDATLADGAPRAAIWSCTPALVVSHRDARLPNFDAACDALADAGTPVLVRDSGGTAVLQGPGFITLSLTHVPPSSLDDSYELLRDAAASAFAPWGIEIGLGAVDGAFCDGKHNLVAQGRKLAGTAQRRRRRRYPAALVHAVLLIDVDVVAMTRTINRFYALAGSPQTFLAESCIALRDLAPPEGLVARSIDALSRAAADWLGSP